eukprot:3002382-Pyramimonas_sp.AAC.1
MWSLRGVRRPPGTSWKVSGPAQGDLGTSEALPPRSSLRPSSPPLDVSRRFGRAPRPPWRFLGDPEVIPVSSGGNHALERAAAARHIGTPLS